MSYVSPIKIGYEAEPEEGWTDKIGRYMAGEVDNLVLQSCVKAGCHVDKDELEKALRYDRDQYVKGYEDGKRDAAAAIEALQAEVQSYKALADEWKASVENKERLLGLYRAEQAKRFYSAMDNNGRVIQNPCACMNIPVFPDSSESPNS